MQVLISVGCERTGEFEEEPVGARLVLQGVPRQGGHGGDTEHRGDTGTQRTQRAHGGCWHCPGGRSSRWGRAAGLGSLQQ